MNKYINKCNIKIFITRTSGHVFLLPGSVTLFSYSKMYIVNMFENLTLYENIVCMAATDVWNHILVSTECIGGIFVGHRHYVKIQIVLFSNH